MSFSVAVVIATFILGATALALTVMMASRKRQAREEELKAAASARGWKFESTLEHGHRIHKWTGSTDGVNWRAESLMSTARGNSRERRRHIGRWHGDFNPGINRPIICMGVPKGKEIPSISVPQGDSLFARLAQKAAGFALDKAIDVFFGEAIGKDVDAGALHRVDTKVPGFIVMAADKDEGARILSQGLERALLAAVDDKTSLFGSDDRPSILLLPHGISLARMEAIQDLNQLDALVRAGVELTRHNRFASRTNPGPA